MQRKAKDMNDNELLLSDEFVEFSKVVAQVHETKKAIESNFKKVFDEYKAKKAELESKVAEASAKWEAWKKDQAPKK
jgi:uncharacterized protein YeeX (DUF496 family)